MEPEGRFISSTNSLSKRYVIASSDSERTLLPVPCKNFVKVSHRYHAGSTFALAFICPCHMGRGSAGINWNLELSSFRSAPSQ